jgi:hypothetical protein
MMDERDQYYSNASSRRSLACIGYGSLIWNPGNLAPHLQHPDQWFADGPLLPVEFARESSRQRITLAIITNPTGYPNCATYWTTFNHDNINTARKQLADREACGEQYIGLMTTTGQVDSTLPPALLDVLKTKMEEKELDGMIWTELPCGFMDRRGQVPSVEEVCACLERLLERGITKTPRNTSAKPHRKSTPLTAGLSRNVSAGHRSWKPNNPVQ